MKKIEIAKEISCLALAIGSNVIVNDAVSLMVHQRRGVVNTVCISVTAMVMTDMLAEKLSDHLDKQIDKVVDWFRKEVKTDA